MIAPSACWTRRAEPPSRWSVAWRVSPQPDNSRTPARRAATRRWHFTGIWPLPADISSTGGKKHTYEVDVTLPRLAAWNPVRCTYTWRAGGLLTEDRGSCGEKGATGGLWIPRNHGQRAQRPSRGCRSPSSTHPQRARGAARGWLALCSAITLSWHYHGGLHVAECCFIFYLKAVMWRDEPSGGPRMRSLAEYPPKERTLPWRRNTPVFVRRINADFFRCELIYFAENTSFCILHQYNISNWHEMKIGFMFDFRWLCKYGLINIWHDLTTSVTWTRLTGSHFADHYLDTALLFGWTHTGRGTSVNSHMEKRVVSCSVSSSRTSTSSHHATEETGWMRNRKTHQNKKTWSRSHNTADLRASGPRTNPQQPGVVCVNCNRFYFIYIKKCLRK